ncbi:hypothetical protein K435DRAFT_648774 [Dendrothele bispora CBS 962.96]|uniref:DUF6593 domain-containing protein n=1 Tax=Dendrothele bispora (strain CBS 962.96) TaxID=1314807 RepID=A0A4S8MP31_DENBC|nr:hypothetical protein K435DRAFT_648774 [Dendrothele bispora CBS 962.96]
MHNNPFYSWDSSDNSNASVYGALPSANPEKSTSNSNSLALNFTSMNPNILNCTVVGPNNQPYYYVVTDSSLPGYTVFKSNDNKSVALVEWKRQCQIEIRDIVCKQPASSFLSLSPDRQYRVMTVAGQQYMWAPRNDVICLYTGGSSSPTLLAQLSKKKGTMKLELAPSAVQAGLLLPSLAAVVLLQSGQRID